MEDARRPGRASTPAGSLHQPAHCPKLLQQEGERKKRMARERSLPGALLMDKLVGSSKESLQCWQAAMSELPRAARWASPAHPPILKQRTLGSGVSAPLVFLFLRSEERRVGKEC